MTCFTHPATANQTFLVSDGEDVPTTELPIPDKVKLDAEYLQRQSLAFDVRILWLTFVKVLRRDGVLH